MLADRKDGMILGMLVSVDHGENALQKRLQFSCHSIMSKQSELVDLTY